MKHLTLTFLLLFTSIGLAAPKDSDKLSQTYINQFRQQCMDATSNGPLCNCAVQAYKETIPASESSLRVIDGDTIQPSKEHPGHPANPNVSVVEISDESLEILAVEVSKCEEQHPK